MTNSVRGSGVWVAAWWALALAVAVAPAAEPQLPKIEVLPSNWGTANRADITALLRSVASELWKHVPDRAPATIHVSQSEQGPIVLFQRGPNGEYQVQLNTKDTYWSQYSFQFAHELSHILCDYRGGQNPNQWFEESICEAASLFALRRMAETWQTTAPYPNWKSYHKALYDYAEQRLREGRLPPDRTLAAWYGEHAEALRANSGLRDKNLIVATALLPLIEKSPSCWAAMSALNRAPTHRGQTLAEYLGNWRKHAPEAHRGFVDAVAEQFGVTLAAE